ncbi:MAG: DUF4265 domain-containing protein [Chloroflexia bacterium]
MAEHSGLVKIWAAEPDNEGGESFWARPLGNSLYEIQNIVMFAPGLHPLDIVRCKEVEDMLPEVIEVVSASGWKSVGIIFREDTSATEDNHIDVMWTLRQHGCASEKAERLRFAFAIPPEADFEKILQFLQEQEEQGILYFDDLE